MTDAVEVGQEQPIRCTECASLVSALPCPNCSQDPKMSEAKKSRLERENDDLARQNRELREKLTIAQNVAINGSKQTPAPPTVPLTGSKAESSEDEYRSIYDNELPLNMVLPSLISVKDMTNDQILDKIHELQETSKIVKIKWQMAYITLNQKLEGETEEERERVRRKDASYRPKVVIEGERKKRETVAKPKGSTEDKAIAVLIPMFLAKAGGDPVKAKEMVLKHLGSIK